MIRRLLLAAALLAAGTLVSGCAVTDEQGQAGSSAYTRRVEDPARVGLPPPYRVFFDELKDEGDWTLIEPYGWVFRPRVNFGAWRPYQDGWWEPSDFYGWIWNTYEPFGWVTYHYGAWFYDEYQGWVWQPGGQWGPAWVAWVDAGDFVGWGPLAPAAYDAFDRVPDGVFTYAPAAQLAARDVGQQATFVSHLPQNLQSYKEIINVGRVNGVSFNKGPDLLELRRRGGSVGEPFDAATMPRVKIAAGTPRSNEADLQARTARLFTAGRGELRRMVESGVAPPSSGAMPHAQPAPPPSAPHFKPPSQPAIPDSVRARRSPRPRVPADTTSEQRKPPRRAPRSPEAVPDSTQEH